MTQSLPGDVQRVFERFLTTEYTTVDGHGQPITWPVTPYYRPGGPVIDVTTGLGYPKKARDAEANPKVGLLFSDPKGSGIDGAPQVLVQGTADVDDRDLDANADRYTHESVDKIPSFSRPPPKLIRNLGGWYFKRVYVHVRPERVYVWPGGDPAREPELYDAHMEEVRSGHDEEPDVPHPAAAGGEERWDERIEELGERYPSAVLSLVAPDGFPFSLRLPIEVDRAARRIRLGTGALGVPVQPGLACLCAHEHDEEFSWQQNFQVRGDLVEEDGGWALVPRKLVGGFELPKGGLRKLRANWSKIRRYRKVARRELQRRK